ncbi:MAG: hypothetical protein R3Y53_11700 [Bacillota bacterium]
MRLSIGGSGSHFLGGYDVKYEKKFGLVVSAPRGDFFEKLGKLYNKVTHISK